MDENIPPTPQEHISRGAKFGLGLVVTIISVGALIFGSMFVYYALQFKYGDAQDIERLAQNIQNSKFTVADSSKVQRTEAEKPIQDVIKTHNPTLGPSSAPVTVLAFIDFECPFCQASYPTFKNVMNTYKSGVKFVFKHMPLTTIHPNALAAAHASQCAHEQDRFWDYYDMLFTKKQFDIDSMTTIATQLGLNTDQFTGCIERQTYGREIQDDLLDGLDLGVRGTPTYFVNQTILEGVADKSTWDALILNELK